MTATTFQYVALDASGLKVEGEVSAGSRAEAVVILGRQRLQPVSLQSATQAKTAPRRAKGAAAPPQLTTKDAIQFTEELADLLDAGLQLDPALKIMEGKAATSRVGRAAAMVREMVREGTRLSQALPAVSPRFAGLYSNLVAAGEIGGALGVILRRQVEYLTVMQELRSKVIQALIYPSFVFGAGILLMTIFMTVLVPQLSMLFSKSGKGMPLPTQILINLSQLFTSYWWVMLLAIMGAGIGFGVLVSKPRGKAAWHRALLHIPLVGGIARANFHARFAHTLANLTSNGIALLDAIRLFNGATTNLYLRYVLTGVADRVGEGAAFSKVLARAADVFPPDFTDLVGVGEQTGDLPAALAKTAIRFDKTLSVRIQRVTALIQPVVIFFLAVVVGLFAYSILSGIFQAVSGLGPGR
ncbi:MAG: type II secretion system F family protein [Cupriavidus sp.]|nr:MAG: type II secretion system F family protein [Cupriavidus sp.]